MSHRGTPTAPHLPEQCLAIPGHRSGSVHRLDCFFQHLDFQGSDFFSEDRSGPFLTPVPATPGEKKHPRVKIPSRGPTEGGAFVQARPRGLAWNSGSPGPQLCGPRGVPRPKAHCPQLSRATEQAHLVGTPMPLPTSPAPGDAGKHVGICLQAPASWTHLSATSRRQTLSLSCLHLSLLWQQGRPVSLNTEEIFASANSMKMTQSQTLACYLTPLSRLREGQLTVPCRDMVGHH